MPIKFCIFAPETATQHNFTFEIATSRNETDNNIGNLQPERENEIIIYQPDSTVKLEVRLEDETVWLTQQQIADLFGTKRPAITKHLANIYRSGN